MGYLATVERKARRGNKFPGLSQQEGPEGESLSLKRLLEKLYTETLNGDGNTGVLFLFSRKQTDVIQQFSNNERVFKQLLES